MTRAGLALLVLVVLRLTALDAQVVDTTRADSLRRDTTDYTALVLRTQQEARRTIPVAPRIGAQALFPAGTRLVLARDSIWWHNAETVGDLLDKIPGVYLLRGGWAGRPELPTYQAHGATSVDYVLDGMPFQPLGQDSLMVDPSLFPLSFIDRVEVERLPGHLRVLLFTRHHDRSSAYSRISVASGDLGIARYQGHLEKRSPKGPGFVAAFEHLNVPVQEGDRGEYKNTQTWLRADFVRSPHWGAEVQFFRNAPDREAVLSGGSSGDTLSRARHGSRRDLLARVYFAPGNGGLGPRLDLLASRSDFTDKIQKDSVPYITGVLNSSGTLIGFDTAYHVSDYKRGVTQLGALAAFRSPISSLEGSFFWRSAWTPLDARLRGGIAPNRWFTLGVEGVLLRHEESRASKWVTARAGLTLPGGITASAVWRKGKEVVSPALPDDAAQDVDDRTVSLEWRLPFFQVGGSFTTNAPFRPVAYAQYPALDHLAPSPRTDWIAVWGRLAPRQWLVLDGWYSSPRALRPDGQPPAHALINATIQSKFLPTFKSGIFNLKLQLSAERWGSGVLGRDTADAPISVDAATYVRGYIGLQIGSFMAYYDRYNLQGNNKFYVPGLAIPGFASTFGVRWEFAN